MTPESHSLLVANPVLINRTARDLLDELKEKLDAVEAKGELIDGDFFVTYMDSIKLLDPTIFEVQDPLETLRHVVQRHSELFFQPEDQTIKTSHRISRIKRLPILVVVAIGLSLILGVNLLQWVF